jgi:hypothetical protein
MRASISIVIFLFIPSMLWGQIPLLGPTTEWISLGADYDFFGDQQTGDAASDIVGTADDPGFLTSFDGGGTSLLSDGWIGFRIRLDTAGGNASGAEFGRNLWVGIDADLNGSVDVFLGVNRQGSTDELAIFAPGSGENVSPSTTTIAKSAYATYALSSTNYDYRPVDYTTDGGTTNDLTTATTGDPDYYLSFLLPFADVVSFLEASSLSLSIDEDTALHYVVATSTQSNSLNQDIGGVDGEVNSTTTWEVLGSFTPTVNPTGELIPEPSVAMLLCSILVFPMRRRRSVRG